MVTSRIEASREMRLEVLWRMPGFRSNKFYRQHFPWRLVADGRGDGVTEGVPDGSQGVQAGRLGHWAIVTRIA